MNDTTPRPRDRQGSVGWGRWVLVASLFLGSTAAASDFESEVDALFAGFAGGGTPGCAVGVIENGEFLYRKAWGMANLEYDIPLGTDSVFRIGSVSKQFTATAILLLAEQGRLDLDVDVHAYLPDLAAYGHEVSLRQMLTHTAGMGDYGDFPDLFRNAAGGEFRWGNEDYLSTAEFYDKVRQAPLLLPPGTKFLYSNFAYFLLSQVVERVSGVTLSQFSAQNIFQPLGMSHSQFYDDVNRIVRNRADGYHQKDDGSWEWYGTNLPYVGDGGVYTTVDDFLFWDRHFYANQLGKGGQELIETMETPGPLTRVKEDGGEYEYAMAQEISERGGHRMVSHGGSWQAFRAWYGRLPQLHFSAVVLCNRPDAGAYELGPKVIDLYLAGRER